MGLFKPKPPVDIDEFEWLFVCFSWLHRHFGAPEAAQGFVPSLARPDTAAIAGANSATELFEAVRILAGMEEWHCELEQGDSAHSIAELVPVGQFNEDRALGLITLHGNTPIIRHPPLVEF